MSKCSSIWNKAHRSTLASEAIEDIASMKVTVPCVTRWSSEYCAISKLIAPTDDQLGKICEDLGVSSKRHPCEIAFLKEYSTALQPLAFSIDLLQGEKKCFLGFLIPTILSLKSKLSEKMPLATFSAHIITAVIEAIERRFGPMLSTHEAKMATVTMPKFRLCWFNPGKTEAIRSTFVQEAASMENTHSEEVDEEAQNDSDESEDHLFFVFGGATTGASGTAEDEVYLEDKDKSLDSLKSFPRVQNLFLKYNTTLPSSAPVERLFSYGGNLFTPQRNRMSDAHLEHVLLLRYNSNFCLQSSE
ncbi:uncharacterized protein LOC123492602 [Coregonus clupeaformis]|uniref:uncharacterized protein LOC123492602 n=1 Tax=Coregonus clupeaformis TaxID=59861 RepID=UPI001E1C5A47|nr:uncharacterized protein LOC123492602 [Coregonus clupeaformis]